MDYEEGLLEKTVSSKDKFKTDVFVFKKKSMTARSLIGLMSFIGIIIYFVGVWDILSAFPLQTASFVLQAAFLFIAGGLLFSYANLVFDECRFLWGVYHEETGVLEFIEHEYMTWRQLVFIGLYIVLVMSTFVMFAQAHEGFSLNPTVCNTFEECQSVFANYAILWLAGIVTLVFTTTHFFVLKNIN